MDKLSQPIFFQLTKVDVAQRTVEGIATAEQPDKAGEICDYESTKPHYQKWSEGIKKASGGKSLGNVRAMHSNIAAGKVTDLQFDDVAKAIRIVAKIVDDGEWKKVEEGVYTGFSQGGEYVRKWEDGEHTRYTANPSEVSIVDNPCLSEAVFECVKEDGTSEMRKFHKPSGDGDGKEKGGKLPEQVWKTTDGKTFAKRREAEEHQGQIDADEFARQCIGRVVKIADEIENQLDKREFSDEERKKLAESGHAMEDGSFPIVTEHDLKNAIRAVGRAKDPAKAKEHIKERAKAMGLESELPDDWHEKVVKKLRFKKDVKKGLYEVSRIACLLEELDWMHNSLEFEEVMEGDGSENPEHLAEIIKELCEFLTALAQEETSEMVEDKGGTGIELPAEVLEAAAGLPAVNAAAFLKILDKADAPAKFKLLGNEVQKAKAKHEEEHDHSKHVEHIHKAAAHIMHKCMKAMGEMDGEDAEKVAKAMDEVHGHLESIHKKAAGICERCMKMGSKYEPEEETELDEEHSSVKKLAKAQAERDALVKAVEPLKEKLEKLQERIDHLEKQPAQRKAALFAVDQGRHEVRSGDEPVETVKKVNLSNVRMSPEEQRAAINLLLR